MASEIVMPQLGLTMTEGTVVRWLKRVGDRVEKNEPLFEVETDKVVQEVLSLEEGVLSEIVVEEGRPVPVGTVIAYMGAPGEVLADAGTRGRGDAEVLRRGDGESGGRGELGTRHPELGTSPSSSFVRVSPAAKKLAERLGVDYRTLRGSGPGGRVIEEDVRRAAASSGAPAVPSVAQVPPSPRPPVPPSTAARSAGESIPLRGIRKVVAERMAHSFSTVPHFYLTAEVDASALMALHRQVAPAVERKHGVKLTLTDLLVKATAMALKEHPEANAAWSDGGIRQNPVVSLGVAAATDDGLVVPVIPEADRLTLVEIARKRGELVEKARAGKLTLPDLEGGSFTLSNLGMFGVDLFQAIVNPPQAAILAVGRIKDRPVAVDGQVAVRPTMFVTLSSDHRILDGALAARFLARVVQLLENPAEMLLAEGGI